jgi:hypothetical protein
MGTITITEAKLRGAFTLRGLYKSASQVLKEDVQKQRTDRSYTIFMSHASMDSDVILGVKGILEDLGYSVYIDWIEDPQLDRSKVTPETAATLRGRMNTCQSLFYAITENSSSSKWMPWECGYFDGKKQRTAILPVTQSSTQSFVGQEYLSLYPYIITDPRSSDNKARLWVHRTPEIYVEFKEWLGGAEPRRH